MSELPTVRHGVVSRTAAYGSVFLAQRERSYDAARVRIEPLLTGSAAETIRRPVDGEVELAGCSPGEQISAVRRGADLVVGGWAPVTPVSAGAGSRSGPRSAAMQDAARFRRGR